MSMTILIKTYSYVNHVFTSSNSLYSTTLLNTEHYQYFTC